MSNFAATWQQVQEQIIAEAARVSPRVHLILQLSQNTGCSDYMCRRSRLVQASINRHTNFKEEDALSGGCGLAYLR